MNSDTFQTGGEAGQAQSSQAPMEDRLAAVVREARAEAIESLEGAEVEDAEPEQAESEEIDEVDGEAAEAEADDEVDEAAENASEQEDEEEVEESSEEFQWDGRRESVPDDLRPYFDHLESTMQRGVQKYLHKIKETGAQKQAELDSLIAQYQQALVTMQNGPAPARGSDPNSRPEPPGANATDAEWRAYDEAYERYMENKVVSRLQESGQLPNPNDLASVKEQQILQNRLQTVVSQPGATQEIMFKMRDMVESNEGYLKMYHDSDESAVQLFNLAKAEVERESILKENAELKKKAALAERSKAKRKAGAAKRAVPRPGGGKAAETPDEVFTSSSFKNTDEALDHFKREALQELR